MKLPKTPDGEEKPKSLLDKVITATPVVMTVVATVLAGLSSSEMSQAQYFRSVAAQQQSKASDQWSLFQAKRQRAISANHTAELIGALGDADLFSLDTLLKISATTQASADGDLKTAAGVLAKPQFPAVSASFGDAAVDAAYKAVAGDEAEEVDREVFAKVNAKALQAAIRKSIRQTKDAEDAVDPSSKGIDKMGRLIHGLTPAGQSPKPEAKQAAADFTAARLRFEDARERYEAKLNQVTAYLYEVSVRKSTIDSERHQTRSRYFFFGMLGAQAAVTLATIALAARERSTLWTLAAAIGVIAMVYAGYVYLFT